MDDIWLIIFFILLGIITLVTTVKSKRKVKIDFKHVNEESYQNYAKFFGNIIPSDVKFNEKLNTVFELVRNGEYDIKKIADKSSCTLDECILKINYLRNKRLLGDIYVDTANFKILPCNKEDQRLLDKYRRYIYDEHLQMNEIANRIDNKGYKDIDGLRKEVYKEIMYLYKKGLINGIRIDEIDRKIIYYTIEKKKKREGYESVHCSNCGAINDVEISGKTRCGYCNNIIEGTESSKIL